MKRPSFQFYPADWRNNAKLRRCSEAARGAWMDVLCVLHDMDEYGVCRWPLSDLARSANISLKLIKELVDKGVLKGSDKNAEPYIFTPRHAGKNGEPVTLVENNGLPLWYCSRFVRDEYVRQKRGGETRFTSEDNPKGKSHASEKTERAKLREAVFSKNNGRCHHCDSKLASNWEIDHLQPKSKGGSDNLSNLVPSCVDCNQAKRDTLPSDFNPPNSTPTRTFGERQGDGSTSTSASTSTTDISNSSENTTLPNVDKNTQRTLVTEICIELTNLQLPPFNRDRPDFLKLVESGATVSEFVNTALEIKSKDKSKFNFEYLVSVVAGRRRDVASMGNLHQGAMPAKSSREAGRNAAAKSIFKSEHTQHLMGGSQPKEIEVKHG